MTEFRNLRTELPKFNDRCTAPGFPKALSRYLLGTVETPQVIEEAFHRGINFFLLGADLHWPTYENTRRGLESLLRLPGIREQISVAAISYVQLPNAAASAFRETLEAVSGLEYLDLLVIGGAEDSNFVSRLSEYRAHLERNVANAHGIGASFQSYPTMLMARDARAVDIAFTPFNAGRWHSASVILSHDNVDRAPPLYALGGAYPYRSDDELKQAGLPAGKWRPHRTDYYRYVMTWSAFDGAIISNLSCADLDSLADALKRGPLDDDELDYLVDLDDLVNQRAAIAE